MKSLRIRLILLFGVAILIATALQFTASFRTGITRANKLFDYHMQQIALALEDSSPEESVRYMSPQNNNGFEFVVQIWSSDGTQIYQSGGSGMLPPRGLNGYSDVKFANGQIWRVYTAQANSRTIQVSQKMATRENRAISMAMNSVWPAIPVSLLLFVAAWWLVTAALAPLNRIGHELASRNADSLAPVSDYGVPKEVSLLVAELNSLLARMTDSLQSKKRFVDDAAHELRSPLTALKLQVQTFARAKDEAAREQGIARMLGGVDRASRLVEQLLELARHDPLSHEAEPAAISLSGLLEQSLSDVAPLASSKDIQLQRTGFAYVEIYGDTEGLRSMIRNLLDNAIRYTPDQGQVQVNLATDGSTVTLTIEDSGPGISEQNRTRVFDRFYRVPGVSPTGSGLGLAIVKAIADRHGAAVELGAADIGGLSVKITFRSAHATVPDAEQIKRPLSREAANS